jgi:phosphatidylethanolamine-binding protein (PEBP) family uncharacterized protein
MPKGRAHVHFRPPARTITGSALVLALLLSGCGSSSSPTSSSSTSTSASTSTSKSSKATASAVPLHPQMHTAAGGPLSTSISVHSGTLAAGQALDRRYTCDGGDTPLPITWSGLPAKTAEVALFVITAGNVQGQLGLISVNWGVSGLKPTAGGLEGKLPAGAVVGANAEGKSAYSICPPKGTTGYFAVLVYALPHPLTVKPGFNASALRETVSNVALAGGLFVGMASTTNSRVRGPE